MQKQTFHILTDLIGDMELRQNHLDDLATQAEENNDTILMEKLEARSMELDRWINNLRDMVESA